MTTDANVTPANAGCQFSNSPKPALKAKPKRPTTPAELAAFYAAEKQRKAAASAAAKPAKPDLFAEDGKRFKRPADNVTPFPQKAPRDFITVLKSLDKPLAKTIARATNGELEIRTNAKAYEYSGDEKPVVDIYSLGAALDEVSTHTHRCVVRGKIADTADRARMRRLIHDREEDGAEVKATLEEAPHRWLLLDVDNIKAPPDFDPLANAADTVAVVKSALPLPFKDVTCWYQLTSGAGVKPDIRIRLGFWLNRALSNEELKLWLAKSPIDKSLFSANQPHYTATPIIAPRAVDPLAGRPRSGIIRGAVDVVPVPEITAPEVPQSESPIGDLPADMPKTLDDCLAAIGDHPGGLGCHAALKRAVSAYFRKQRAGASTKVLVAALTQAVRSAKWDDKKHSKQYLQDEIDGLPRLIESVQGLQRETEKPKGIEPVPIAEREAPPTEAPTEATAKPPRLFSLSCDEGAALALTHGAEPLIDGLIDCNAMSVIYGESNSGKSFSEMDKDFHIAADMPWAGRAVKQGAVVWVAAEGGRGVYKRLAALVRHYKRQGVPLFVVPCPVNLRRGDADVKPLIDLIKKIEADCGQKVVKVTIDTLSRVLDGGDENSSVDMGHLVKHFDAIRAAVDCHLAVVHHSGKDRARGARGHSALRAATDTVVEVADRCMTATKQRDLEGDIALQFKLHPIRIGIDSRGKEVTSCWVEVAGQGELPKEQLPLDGETSVFADALEDGLRDKYGDDIKDRSFTTAFAIKYAPNDERVHQPDSRAMRQHVNRMMNTMHKKGWLGKHKRGQWVWLVEHDEHDAQI
jgi:hypothetical protein